MRAESLKSAEKSCPIPMAAAWPTVMKSSAANEGEEQLKLMMMMMAAKKNLKSKGRRVEESKKKACICICSPTSHAGSFRCHLHRATSTPPPPNNKLNKSKLQPVISRFGRA